MEDAVLELVIHYFCAGYYFACPNVWVFYHFYKLPEIKVIFCLEIFCE